MFIKGLSLMAYLGVLGDTLGVMMVMASMTSTAIMATEAPSAPTAMGEEVETKEGPVKGCFLQLMDY